MRVSRASVEMPCRGGVRSRRRGRRWWLDPIDGTKKYARGVPIWATLIALERGGEMVVGVVSAPALGQRWWAERGGGAFLHGTPIRVSDVATLGSAYVSTTSLRGFSRFADLAGRVAVARTYTDFWQYMLVAEGRIEAASDTLSVRGTSRRRA